MSDKREIKISVIIPVYNVKQYICECLDSLVKQQFKEYEIIYVDDCSNDGTYDILLEYEKHYNNIKILRNEENAGAAISRNKGLQHAKGKYVIFLDSDDKYHNLLLYKLYCVCEEKEADAAFCLYSSFDDCGNSEANQSWQEELLEDDGVVEDGWKKDILFKFPIFQPYNKLVLRELLIEKRIEFQNIPNANDVLYSLLVMTFAQKIALVNDELVYYRINRSGNLSDQRRNKKTYEVSAFEGYIKRLMEDGLWYDSYIKRTVSMVLKLCYGLVSCRNSEVKDGILEDFANKVSPLIGQDINGGIIHLSKWDRHQYNYLSGSFSRGLNSKYQVLSENIDSYLEERNGKKLALWGAGKLGKLFLDATDGKNIEYIIDNDIAKQGSQLCGKEIVSFEAVADLVDEVIVLNPRFVGSIRRQVAGKCPVIDLDEVLDNVI